MRAAEVWIGTDPAYGDSGDCAVFGVRNSAGNFVQMSADQVLDLLGCSLTEPFDGTEFRSTPSIEPSPLHDLLQETLARLRAPEMSELLLPPAPRQRQRPLHRLNQRCGVFACLPYVSV